MRFFILVLPLLVSIHARAAIGDIKCTAEQFEVTKGGLKDHVIKPLTLEKEAGSVRIFSVDIGERGYVLNGDVKSGDFMLTQAWGPDYTFGIQATASFTSDGRLQISHVEQTKVFKLVCVKTTESQFPKE